MKQTSKTNDDHPPQGGRARKRPLAIVGGLAYTEYRFGDVSQLARLVRKRHTGAKAL